MAPISAKKRRVEDEVRRPKKKIRIKKQAFYHSSSEDEDDVDKNPRNRPQALRAPSAEETPPAEEVPHAEEAEIPKSILKDAPPILPNAVRSALAEFEDKGTGGELERNTRLNQQDWASDEADQEGEEEEDAEAAEAQELEGGAELDSEEAEDSESETSSLTSSQLTTTKKKRNDPTAFATSISKILDTKLSTAKRPDPVLSRSKTAADANRSIADGKLETAARAQVRAERKRALEKGRVRDVLALETEGVETGKVLEEERRLKKTAQRGVVKLFNAVRAAQVKAEEGLRQAKQEGVVGMGKREERVNEMSKQGFLDLISRGGKEVEAA